MSTQKQRSRERANHCLERGYREDGIEGFSEVPGKNDKRQWTQIAQGRLQLGIGKKKKKCSQGEWSSTATGVQRGPCQISPCGLPNSTGPGSEQPDLTWKLALL